MVNNSITFIGLDTHKAFFEMAHIEANREAKPVSLGRINGTKPALQQRVRQFESKYPGSTSHFVNEAGPSGYWICRFLTSLGHLLRSCAETG